MEELAFENRQQFRQWLEQNHNTSKGVWLVYCKKNSGLPTISYTEAVEEALCFGWIDSKVQTIDSLRYKQVFTPRNSRSMWSETNKKRIRELISAGLMTSVGIKIIDVARNNGKWKEVYSGSKNKPEIPEILKTALQQSPQAMENFNNFAPSYRATYIHWVNNAKRPETKKRRIIKIVENSLKI